MVNSELERLIQLATRPLAENPEHRHAAEVELRKSLEAHAVGRDQAIGEAIASFEMADRHPYLCRLWNWIYGTIFLILVFLFVNEASQVARSTGALKWLATSVSGQPSLPSSKLPNLTPDQSLLLYGDRQAKNKADQWKPLWDQEPTNPVYFATYAAAYFKEHKKLSPEILIAAEQVDPDNGWYLAMAVSANTADAVKREKRSSNDVQDGKAASLTVINESLLNEKLALLHQVASKPRFTAHQEELLREQISLFPPRQDWLSQIPLMAHVVGLTSPAIPLRELGNILAAGAEERAAKRDVEGFRQIVKDWHSLVRKSAEGGFSLIDLLVAKVNAIGPSANFRDAAGKLGLEETEFYFTNLDELGKQEKERRDKLSLSENAESKSLRQKGSIFGSLMNPGVARQVQHPPVFTDEHMRPARYAEHAFFGRVILGIGWCLCLVLALAHCACFIPSPASRLAKRMTNLLQAKDWFLIVVGGVVFPVIWYLSITRLTPLSAREWSPTWLMFTPVLGQFFSFLLSLFILPSAIASLRLSMRAALFGLAPRLLWLRWIAAAAALAGVPAFGAVWLYADGGLLIGLPAAFPVCAILAWTLAAIFFRGGATRLRHMTLGQVLLPVWCACMLMLALLVRFHYLEEKHWVKRDTMGEISIDSPAQSRYEYEVIQILRNEVLEMVGTSPVL